MKTNPTMQAEAVLPTRPVSENGKINILTRLAYGGGDVACNVVYGMIATLLTLFYTDYAGVSVATVGLVMLISRFFDGGSDVVMGFIVDRTHSKWGQSRPWILWMSLPYALSAILLFSVPHTNATIQFLYIFVTYNFCTTVCYTAINLPYGSLSAMMTRDSKERDLLSVFRMGLSPMGRIIAVTCTMPLIKLFGDNQAAWVKVMSIWAAIAFLLLITCFIKCEETVHIAARSEEKIPVGRSLKALVTNQYFWAVLLLWMFQSTNQAVVGTILPYYCKYVFHNDSWMYSTLYLSETIVLIVFTFLCPLLRDTLGKRNMIVAGAVLVLISQGLFFLNTTSFSWCLFTTMLRGVGEAPLCAFVFGMIGDVVEFGQWKHHIRQESFIFAGGSVGTKLGTLSMVDYYGTGVLTIFIFYFFRGRKWWCLAGQLLALYWVNVQLLGGLLYPVHIFGMEFEICQQGLALLALLPIWLYRGRQGYHSKPFQYACYAFYPVHMLILVLILQYLTR